MSNQPQGLEEIGLKAVDDFITTFNSRDPEAWADTLNFPHVRPSPFGPIKVAESKEVYVSNFDYERVIATGWDHSEWDYKRFLHRSPTKLHVAGQWSRYNGSGDKILSTPIVYIVTLQEGHWGIQSRFGCDYVDEDTDTIGFETRVFRLVETFIGHYNNRNKAACAELLNYPHYRVEVGDLHETSSQDEFQLEDMQINLDSIIGLQTGQYSMNLGVELTLSMAGEKHQRQGIVNVTERDGHLGIQAVSLLDPNAEAES